MNRKGFTLIELIIVMAIIGLLAAIAIPQLTNTKERAHIAAMRSDLRNLVTVEESYFADSQKYSANMGAAYRLSAGNEMPTITAQLWAEPELVIDSLHPSCVVVIGGISLLADTR